MKKAEKLSFLRDGAACAAIFATALGLVIFPSQMVTAAKSGVDLCLGVIVPSLLPFFILSSMVVNQGLADKLGRITEPIMRPLFNVGGACASALVLGFIGGYPVGARTVITLYKNGSCTKREAERMLSFSNNSGPAFVLGVVGTGIFSSGRVGTVLYLAHIAASICVGIIFRFWGHEKASSLSAAPASSERESFVSGFIDAVGSSVSSALNICGFVIFFTVFTKLLVLSGFLPRMADILGHLLSPIGLDSMWAEKLLTGMIELTGGVWSLSTVSSRLTASMAMAAFMLGWAGISVHCQVLSFMESSGLSPVTYIVGKFLHGIFSALFILIISRVVPFESPVALYLANQIDDIAGVSFGRALTVSLTSAGVLWMIFVFVSLISVKRGGKKKRKAL